MSSPHIPPSDFLVVVLGLKVFLVTVKAVRQSLDPAGGAQLQAIIDALPFWPSKGDLSSSCMAYIDSLNRSKGTAFQLPAPVLMKTMSCTMSHNLASEKTIQNDTRRGDEMEGSSAPDARTLPPDSLSRVNIKLRQMMVVLEESVMMP